MRIALVSLHTSPLARPGAGDAGGMNVYLVALAEALAAAGHEVELFTRAAGEAPAPDARGASLRPDARGASTTPDARGASATPRTTPGGVPVHHLRAGPARAVPKGELLALVPEFARELARHPRFDVVHAHYWLSALAAREAAAAWGAPLVLSLHTVGAMKNAALAPGDRPEPRTRLDAERALVREAALTVTATEAERRAILALDPAVAPSCVAVLTPGVDTTLFHPATTPPSGRPTVLVLARVQPLKGVELAIDAVAGIPASRRPRLVIAGGASPGHEEYAAGLARRGVALDLGTADLVFLPTQSREAAAELLRETAVLLVPSHSETFGLVALEAAASGVPVLASAAGGLSEAVLDGRTGVVLADRDPALWARTLDALLGDPARRAALGRAALDHAAQHSWPAVAEQLAELYRRVAR